MLIAIATIKVSEKKRGRETILRWEKKKNIFIYSQEPEWRSVNAHVCYSKRSTQEKSFLSWLSSKPHIQVSIMQQIIIRSPISNKQKSWFGAQIISTCKYALPRKLSFSVFFFCFFRSIYFLLSEELLSSLQQFNWQFAWLLHTKRRRKKL